MAVDTTNLNPLENLFNDFVKIIKSLEIKFSSQADKHETKDSLLNGNLYVDAYSKKDTFDTYIDYPKEDLINVGITDLNIILKALTGNTSSIPYMFKDNLLKKRRQRVLDNFTETNNYYRMLNGLPDVEDKEYYYISDMLANKYSIDKTIPIHELQDYYNKLNDRGDYVISVIEGTGYVDKLIAEHPEKKYLNFIGTNRISIFTSRSASNYQIIQIRNPDVKRSFLDEFVSTYEQCREYVMTVLYVPQYRTFIEYYDNFIAMVIALMTIINMVSKQLQNIPKREFFNVSSMRTLYEMYNVPYDLSIGINTQNDIIQSLNLLIQNKGTDKVIYNIASLLGLTNISVYKYFLTKERKFDIYGAPIIAYKEKFNPDTGEVETVPDYEQMYDIYFQRAELNDENIASIYLNQTNTKSYDEVVEEDPYWVKDENVYKKVWESTYNFVETKYLSLGLQYSITDIMFENILFLKLIMQKEPFTSSVSLTLPNITSDAEIPLFDTIILLICLVHAAHKSCGEIITVPTQVISVMDYVNNHRDGRREDTLKYNFKYFFNPDDTETEAGKVELGKMKQTLIDHMSDLEKEGKVIDTMQFNFDYFALDNPDREEKLHEVKRILEDEEYERFKKYVNTIATLNVSESAEKVKVINEIYDNIKNLHILLVQAMADTPDRDIYRKLQTMHKALFYSKEMAEVFTITGEYTGHKRTAWTYYEFLYYRNPRLYNAIFNPHFEQHYEKYVSDNGIDKDKYTFIDHIKQIELGNIWIDFGQYTTEASENANEKQTYTHLNHVIGRLEVLLSNLRYLHLLSDSSSPIETLLMRLVRFFKSYSVDILGLDTIIVFDYKPENWVRLFDYPHYIDKTDEIRTHEFEFMDFARVTSNLHPTDDAIIKDDVQVNATLHLDEKTSLKDSIHKMWYSE